MATPPLSDELAVEALAAIEEHGGTKAAKILGINRSTLRTRAAVAKQRGLHLSPGIRDAMKSVGITDASVVSGGWLKTKEASIHFRMPKQPNIDLEAASDRVREALAGIEPFSSQTIPENTDSASLTLYPLPDVHAGMKYRDWGLDEAVERLNAAFAYLIGLAPASETALILILGDLIHHNDRTNKTQSGHVLDVDCTPEEAAAAMIAAIARGIEQALAKHREVVVSVLRGNHDRDSYLIVLYSLLERYRNEPRVQINKADSEFLIFPWEDVLIFAHHGDKGKPERMVMQFAHDYRELWGKAKHSYLFNGHLHHMKMADIGGVQWEQLRAVTVRDDYAVSNSYVGKSSAVAITYHAGRGEVSRVTMAF